MSTFIDKVKAAVADVCMWIAMRPPWRCRGFARDGVDRGNRRRDPHDPPSGRRRSCLSFAIVCEECGDVWNLTLQQHKATVFADMARDPNQDITTAPQLWRD